MDESKSLRPLMTIGETPLNSMTPAQRASCLSFQIRFVVGADEQRVGMIHESIRIKFYGIAIFISQVRVAAKGNGAAQVLGNGDRILAKRGGCRARFGS